MLVLNTCAPGFANVILGAVESIITSWKVVLEFEFGELASETLALKRQLPEINSVEGNCLTHEYERVYEPAPIGGLKQEMLWEEPLGVCHVKSIDFTPL